MHTKTNASYTCLGFSDVSAFGPSCWLTNSSHSNHSSGYASVSWEEISPSVETSSSDTCVAGVALSLLPDALASASDLALASIQSSRSSHPDPTNSSSSSSSFLLSFFDFFFSFFSSFFFFDFFLAALSSFSTSSLATSSAALAEISLSLSHTHSFPFLWGDVPRRSLGRHQFSPITSHSIRSSPGI